MPAPLKQQGFTLVELLVTLVVAAILMTLAVPFFGQILGRMRLEGVVGELGTDLQYARAEALRRHESVTLRVAADGRSYNITVASQNQALKAVALRAGMTLTQDAAVTFDSLRGLAADVAITGLESMSSASLRVKVGALGRVEVCVPEGSSRGYPAC